MLFGHSGGDPGADVVHHRASIEQPGAVGEELVATTDERCLPGAVVVVVRPSVPRPVQQSPSDPRSDAGGMLEDAAHPVIGFERLPVDDPQARDLAGAFRIECADRLLLDDRVDLLEEVEVVRVSAVERHPEKFRNSISGGAADADSG